MARRARKSTTASILEAEARQLGKSLDAQAQQALAKLGRQSAAASAPILAGLHKAWRDIELAVRQSAKRFRETG